MPLLGSNGSERKDKDVDLHNVNLLTDSHPAQDSLFLLYKVVKWGCGENKAIFLIMEFKILRDTCSLFETFFCPLTKKDRV